MTIRSLLEYVGTDTSGKDIRVGDRVVDKWDDVMTSMKDVRCGRCNELIQPYYPLMLNGVYSARGKQMCSSDCMREEWNDWADEQARKHCMSRLLKGLRILSGR
jgi:hypothetical protein